MTKEEILKSNYPRTVKIIGFKNSWGASCGDNGEQFITEEYFTTGKCFAVVTLVYAKPVDLIRHVFSIDMRYGEANNEIKALQDTLKTFGFMDKSVPSSGFYGDITKRAVRDFQWKYSVASPIVLWWNGGKYVGKATRDALNKL
jgi:peptidoglycan hydrolase-like protein with peptidoglycan-binding domain